MDLKEEFILRKRIDESEDLLKKCLPFIQTWYESSAAGMGLGAKRLFQEILEYFEAYK